MAWLPEVVSSASQNVPMLLPAGMSNSTVQAVTVLAVPFVTVYLAW